MPVEVRNAIDANLALALWLLMLPYAPWIAGALAGGITIGQAKDKTAVGEIARGLLSGGGAWLVVWTIQQTWGG